MRCPFVGRGDKGRPLHWALGMLGVPVSYCLEFGLSGPEYGFPLAASFGDHPISHTTTIGTPREPQSINMACICHLDSGLTI